MKGSYLFLMNNVGKDASTSFMEQECGGRGNKVNAVLFRYRIVRLRKLLGMQGLNVGYVDVHKKDMWEPVRVEWGSLSFRFGKIPSCLDQGRQRAEWLCTLEERVLQETRRVRPFLNIDLQRLGEVISEDRR